MGVAVSVLTTNPDGDLSPVDQWEGVTVHRVPVSLVEQGCYLAPEIYKRIKSERCDLVHCQSYHTLVAPMGMLAAWRARIPYVLTFHGGGHSAQWRNAVRGAQLRALRPLLARASRLIACAKFEIPYYSALLRLPTSMFALIPNGSDLNASRSTLKASKEPMLIASVGRLERYKGHHRVIEALPRILERRPETHLLIIGRGPYENALRELASRLRISERVQIRSVDPTNRGGMEDLLRRASLVTLLSEYETHPVAVLEALSLGCPALVADNSGMAELAERGWARSIRLESTAEEVAQAIVEELGRNSSPPAIDLPTWRDSAVALHRLYETIVADRLDARSEGETVTRTAPR
jgi:glycosyltransferase involved in cell wall biosynthesis